MPYRRAEADDRICYFNRSGWQSAYGLLVGYGYALGKVGRVAKDTVMLARDVDAATWRQETGDQECLRPVREMRRIDGFHLDPPRAPPTKEPSAVVQIIELSGDLAMVGGYSCRTTQSRRVISRQIDVFLCVVLTLI